MLSTQLTKHLLHTTDNYIKSLNKWGILTALDLINFFPKSLEDRSLVIDSFSYINIKDKNTIVVKLLSVDNSRTSTWKVLTKAIFEDKNGFMSEWVWFNRNYLATQLNKFIWKKIIISWKVKYDFWKLSFVSPEVETDLSKTSWEVIPVYSDFNYIPGTWIASKMEYVRDFIKEIPETLPEKIIKKYNFISKSQAIDKLHFPKNKHDFEIARERLAYDELYEINYKAISKKVEKQSLSEWKSIPIPLNPDLIKEIISKLPFELTNHQKISLFQILKDMEKNHSMQRLLQWDVWTGKTVVAAISVIHSILESGKNPPIPSYYQPSPLAPQIQPSPQPSPLEERGVKGISIRKYELISPAYVFELSKDFRKNPTESEKKLWQILRNNKFNNLKFRRQHPIWRYIADFYCEELNLVLELDWKIHNEEYQKAYDEERDNLLKNYWFNIIRFKNEDVLNKTDNEIFNLINSPLLQRRGAGGEGINKIQACILAPTEILARQHFEWLENLFTSYGLNPALLVWSTTKKQKDIIKWQLKSWNVDVIIWTHALLEEDVIFNKLGFVIIDEQHRFWVKQREILEKYVNQKLSSPIRGGIEGGVIIPHSLNMTATPIPRTLALTLYWDQDLSIINEYPVWRKIIFTKVASSENERHQIELFVRNQIESWRQVFWISPLVQESEKIDLANAISTYESLTEIFSPFKVWLLHGKMKASEKQDIMKQFENNEIQILSSTSVVEVWVNVPNATIMCIEWAERFGLSQLHQFRWRVWRWEFQSYCYLFPSNWYKTDRLKAMEKTANWFELAEIDLELRWPGEVYWVRQSWEVEFKIADIKDLELVSQIREDIEEMFKKN